MESDLEAIDATCGRLKALRSSAQMPSTARDTVWERWRYGPLLRAASRGLVAGRAFAALAAAVERRVHPERRRVAEDRIRRWLGSSPADASRIFREALRSEALEEADCARWMRTPGDLRRDVEIRGFVPRGGRPRIYGELHAGSPVLAYMALRAQLEPEARIIARELDEENPMADAKQAFAVGKVAWVERVSGTRFIDTDASAILEARDHLLAGRPLFAAVDVPGDVVARVDRVTLFGEPVVLASGIFRLAAMTGADMQLVTSVHRGGRVRVEGRRPIEGGTAEELLDRMAREMEAVIREQPGEFWFWPFFLAPRGEAVDPASPST